MWLWYIMIWWQACSTPALCLTAALEKKKKNKKNNEPPYGSHLVKLSSSVLTTSSVTHVSVCEQWRVSLSPTEALTDFTLSKRLTKRPQSHHRPSCSALNCCIDVIFLMIVVGFFLLSKITSPKGFLRNILKVRYWVWWWWPSSFQKICVWQQGLHSSGSC